jgi:predicted metal-dependent peptidase
MAYTLAFENNNLLHVTITGEFTEEELQAYMGEISDILDTIPAGEMLKSFIDTTQLGRVNPNLRRSVGNFMDNPKFGKTAVLGNSRLVKVMIDFALKASGRHHMHYFTDRKEAMAWLQTDG